MRTASPSLRPPRLDGVRARSRHGPLLDALGADRDASRQRSAGVGGVYLGLRRAGASCFAGVGEIVDRVGHGVAGDHAKGEQGGDKRDDAAWTNKLD